MTKFNIALWDEKKFANSRHEWNDLLANSNVDQLFLSWEWQYTWWQVFAIREQMKLRLLAVYDENNRLAGLAPLYLSTATAARFIKFRRLQFIGNCWRSRDTMLTELQDFITIKSKSTEIINALFSYIQTSKDWDEFVLAGLRSDSETFRILISRQALPGCHLRKAEEYQSYFLGTNSDFKDFLNNIGKNTRLRLFNRRKILESLGKVTFHIDHDNIDNNFNLLNRLHSMRWNNTAFLDERLDFNKRVAQLLAARKALHFSIVSLNDEPVSIQYNYNIGDHVYNIQAGFNPYLHKKLAPGYLHFGYELEHAFKSNTACYDFLAGEGKNTPYKKNLKTSHLDIVDMQVIRTKLLKLLYSVYDRITK